MWIGGAGISSSNVIVEAEHFMSVRQPERAILRHVAAAFLSRRKIFFTGLFSISSVFESTYDQVDSGEIQEFSEFLRHVASRGRRVRHLTGLTTRPREPQPAGPVS